MASCLRTCSKGYSRRCFGIRPVEINERVVLVVDVIVEAREEEILLRIARGGAWPGAMLAVFIRKLMPAVHCAAEMYWVGLFEGGV